MVCKQQNNVFVTPLQQFCNGFNFFDTMTALSNTQKPLQNYCKYVTTMLQFRALGTGDIPCHPGASHSVVNNVEIGHLRSYTFLVSSVEDCL